MSKSKSKSKQSERLNKIKSAIQDYFFNYVEDCEDNYEVRDLIKEAVNETLLNELNFIDRKGFLFFTEDKEEMKFINKELYPLIQKITAQRFIEELWAIHCEHLMSDGRFHPSITDYYIGNDTEGFISYVIIGGNSGPYCEMDFSYEKVFEELIEDRGGKHPDRVLTAIKDYILDHQDEIKEIWGGRGGLDLFGTEFDPNKDYLLINKNDPWELIPLEELEEINHKNYKTGNETIYFHKKTARFISEFVSRYQGSPDYTAEILEGGEKEKLALLSYLKDIRKDRLAIINPYPPYDLIKVIHSNGKSCTPSGWRFNPERGGFEADNGSQQCPPPKL
jgi:hypothetical protein